MKQSWEVIVTLSRQDYGTFKELLDSACDSGLFNAPEVLRTQIKRSDMIQANPCTEVNSGDLTWQVLRDKYKK